MRSWRSQRAAMPRSCVTSTSVVPALAVELEHQLHHLLAGGEIEAAGGLVGSSTAGFTTKARASHALLLAPRAPPGSGQALAQPTRSSISVAAHARIAAPLQLQRRHHVLQRRQVGQQLELWNTKPELARAGSRAGVLVAREQVGAGQPHGAAARRVQPGDDGQQRALARAEAPTMAADSRGARVKSMSWRIVSVPVESAPVW